MVNIYRRGVTVLFVVTCIVEIATCMLQRCSIQFSHFVFVSYYCDETVTHHVIIFRPGLILVNAKAQGSLCIHVDSQRP